MKIENQNLKLGFHIHNNGQIDMANMISSLEHVDIIDASFHGMGRGMGNVRLEDVILFLKIKRKYDLNIEPFLNYLSGSEDKNIKEEIKNPLSTNNPKYLFYPLLFLLNHSILIL